MVKRAIVWFRNDLRLDDNESLLAAAKVADIIPVYVFDDRTYKGKTRQFGFAKTGIHRCQFLIEAVSDLRQRLRALGSDLVVRCGLAEDVIAQLADEFTTAWVYCNRERTQEEVVVQDRLEAKLWAMGQELRFNRGKMLYHTADLPFPVTHTPDQFTQFRKEVERIVQVREPAEAPLSLPPLPSGIDIGKMPEVKDFGWSDYEKDARAAFALKGGETEGLNRLRYYLSEGNLTRDYKESRNGLLGADYSTKLSPYLAAGCLSPKRVMAELRRYEEEKGANEGSYWIFFELLWRDFFRLMAKKYRNQIFMLEGPKQAGTPDLDQNENLLQLWIDGQTGVPFIDAAMRELSATGFMSNRSRQNVASFLVKDLKLDWRMGAEYFESQLVDYDVASNWGNWNYVAGVGSDPREDRYFNILSQARRYDPQGEYVRTWLPELSALSGDSAHRPDLLSHEEQKRYGIRLGVDYPKAVVDIGRWDRGGYQDLGAHRGGYKPGPGNRGHKGRKPKFRPQVW